MDNVHWVYINRDILRETEKMVPTLFLLIDMDGIIPALEQSPQKQKLRYNNSSH